MTKAVLFLTVIMAIISCNSEKTYKYIEVVVPPNSNVTLRDKDPEIIKAASDSEAYIQAYTNFCTSKNVNNQMESGSGVNLTVPVSFKLLNSKGLDIRFAVNFEKKDSIEKSIEARINSRINDVFHNKNNSAEKIDTTTYEILVRDHQPAVENFHILLKSKIFDNTSLQSFVDKFRQEFCSKNCNIYLYDDKSVKSIIITYPLEDKSYLRLADHFVAQSTFDMTEVWLYPFQDIKYKELGGKNWKKRPIE